MYLEANLPLLRMDMAVATVQEHPHRLRENRVEEALSEVGELLPSTLLTGTPCRKTPHRVDQIDLDLLPLIDAEPEVDRATDLTGR
jgi:hypothetical protein